MNRLAIVVVVAAPLAWLLSLSGAVAFPLALAGMMVFASVAFLAGFMLLRAAGGADMPATAAWVLGIFATALAVYALVSAFKLLAASAFAIWGAAVLALGVLTRPAPRLDRGELIALLLCAAATAYWCGELALAPQALAHESVLTTWTDQFGHGSVISQFGDPRGAGRGSILLADVPLAPYHYASYLLPAAFALPLDLPGLPLATSLWVPLGFFTLCAGIYALGNELAGRAGAIAALAALTLVPDPASYGLYNRLFGYYWYVIAVPTASYGVGVCLLAIALLLRWPRAGVRPLAAGACLVVGAALFRLHIFALAFPAWMTCAAMFAQASRARKLAVAAIAAAAFAVFVFAFYRVFPDATTALWEFLHDLHDRQQPTSYRGLYQGLLAFYGPAIALLGGVLLILPASLGIFVVAYPLSVLAMHRARGLQAIDLVPLAVLVWYFLLILTAPIPAHGDATELTQRPFVLLYAVIAIWTAAGFARWVARLGGFSRRRVWLPLVVGAAVSVMLVLRYTVADWRWNYAYKVAEGLPQAAGYLRGNWRPGDTLAVHGLVSHMVNQDLAMQLVSLTGMPTYLAVPFVQARRSGHEKEVMERYALLGEIAREATPATALARLRRAGIHWYVVAESDRRGPGWDPERRHAIFVDRMVAVYSTR